MKKILKSFNFFYVSKLYYWTKKKDFIIASNFINLQQLFNFSYLYYPRETLEPNLATVVCTIENFFHLPRFFSSKVAVIRCKLLDRSSASLHHLEFPFPEERRRYVKLERS